MFLGWSFCTFCQSYHSQNRYILNVYESGDHIAAGTNVRSKVGVFGVTLFQSLHAKKYTFYRLRDQPSL